jgi:hypothetical protein
METNQVTEHLQVIRTLMERSALYRRALEPIMTFAGLVGIAAAIAGCFLRIESGAGFIGYWIGVAFAGVVGAFLLVRRQALKSVEPFWSPPTRRVAQALLPSLASGLLLGVWLLIAWSEKPVADPLTGMYDDAGALFWVPAVWAVFYGCALHAAGFFTSRGLRLFGWLFIAAGITVLFWLLVVHRQDFPLASWEQSHWLMGFLFGFLQLAYGIYLYFTEKRGNES